MTMQYMLIHAGAPDLDDAWNDEAWAALSAWLDDAIGSGVSIEGAPLRLDADATSVKVRDGRVIVTDGPYAETKEQVAGFDVIECASMAEAVGWARRHPHSWMGSVEVRALVGGSPVAHLPEPPAAGKTRYMMLVCTDPAVEGPELARVEPVEPWVAEMSSRGARLFGSELEPTGSARTVRGRDPGAIVTDGPFAETKEQIAGFDVLECADLDEAIEVAAKHPMARAGLVEVRPFRSLEEE
jgi:hypothetical protein